MGEQPVAAAELTVVVALGRCADDESRRLTNACPPDLASTLHQQWTGNSAFAPSMSANLTNPSGHTAMSAALYPSLAVLIGAMMPIHRRLILIGSAVAFSNDASFVDFARGVAIDLVGAENYIPMPATFMGAEDFSYVLQRMPGCMLFLGVMPEGHDGHDQVASCHSNHMILNEDAMAVAIAIHAAIAHRFLAEPLPDRCR
jgi:metal-dependent amidase/aminoacylase/carboxypeptidase family protein